MENLYIREMDLSTRASNCLQRNGIATLKDLMNLKEDDLIKMKNMGTKTIKEIMDFQEQYKDEEIDNHLEDNAIFKYKNQGVAVVGEINSNIPTNAFIFKAFPDYTNLSINNLLYRDINGELQDDIALEKTGLSIRIVNAFKAKGIDSIDAIALMDKDRVFKVRNLGSNSFREIIDYLGMNTEIVLFNNEEKKPVVNAEAERIYNLINDKVYLDYINSSTIKNSVINNINTYIIPEGYLIESFDDIIENEEIINKIFVQENVIDEISVYLDRVISQSVQPQTKQSIYTLFPDSSLGLNLLQMALDLLVGNGNVLLTDIGYVKDRIKLAEWIESLPEKEKIIISLRTSKKTLEECGNTIGVTRERIRQLEAKILKKRPRLYEDYYSNWFMRYEFDLDSFTSIFDEKSEVYYYLNIAYKNGNQSLEAFYNEDITAELYKRIKAYEIRNCLLINGEYVQNNRYDVQKSLIKLFCSEETVRVEDFVNKYNDFLADNGYDKNEKLEIPSSRALERRLADCDYVLMSNHHKFRYYPINEIDVTEIIEQLNLSKYKDVEISTLKIFNDNHMLMEDIDIRDEYELHNFLKKTENEWNDSDKQIKLTRMPFISFGNADRDKQAEDLLFQIAPVSYDEFGQFYEMEYGVKAATALANMTQSISKYYHNGTYEIDQPLLNEEEFKFLKTNLLKDLYFIDDVKKMYSDQFGETGLYKINPRTLKELHFRVYVDYIIRDSYSSAYDYFCKLFLSKEVFTIYQFDKRFIYVQTANQAIEDLRSSYDILEYEDMKFITFNRLNSIHKEITKDTFRRYVSKVDLFVSDDFFTLHSLKIAGLDDNLHDIGFGEWFNAAIVKNSRQYRFIKTGNNIVFSKNNSQFTTVDFIRHVLIKFKKMNIYDFISYLKDNYNVNIPKDKIVYLIKDSGIYYDSIMEKIYLNKDEYYEDI